LRFAPMLSINMILCMLRFFVSIVKQLSYSFDVVGSHYYTYHTISFVFSSLLPSSLLSQLSPWFVCVFLVSPLDFAVQTNHMHSKITVVHTVQNEGAVPSLQCLFSPPFPSKQTKTTFAIAKCLYTLFLRLFLL
jgi:hypothetical protein